MSHTGGLTIAYSAIRLCHRRVTLQSTCKDLLWQSTGIGFELHSIVLPHNTVLFHHDARCLLATNNTVLGHHTTSALHAGQALCEAASWVAWASLLAEGRWPDLHVLSTCVCSATILRVMLVV